MHETIKAKGNGTWSCGAAFVAWVGSDAFNFIFPEQLALFGELQSLEKSGWAKHDSVKNKNLRVKLSVEATQKFTDYIGGDHWLADAVMIANALGGDVDIASYGTSKSFSEANVGGSLAKALERARETAKAVASHREKKQAELLLQDNAADSGGDDEVDDAVSGDEDDDDDDTLLIQNAPDAVKRHVQKEIAKLNKFGINKMKENHTVLLRAPNPYLLNLKDGNAITQVNGKCFYVGDIAVVNPMEFCGLGYVF